MGWGPSESSMFVSFWISDPIYIWLWQVTWHKKYWNTDIPTVFPSAEFDDIIACSLKGQMFQKVWSCQKRLPWCALKIIPVILINSRSLASTRSTIGHDFHSYHFYGNNVRLLINTILWYQYKGVDCYNFYGNNINSKFKKIYQILR